MTSGLDSVTVSLADTQPRVALPDDPLRSAVFVEGVLSVQDMVTGAVVAGASFPDEFAHMRDSVIALALPGQGGTAAAIIEAAREAQADVVPMGGDMIRFMGRAVTLNLDNKDNS